MNRDELLRDLDSATRAGDMELARAIDSKLAEVETPRANQLPTWQLRGLANATGGALRGAASIGSTLLGPFGLDRRGDVTAGLKTMGFDTDSGAFAGGKLGAEIAGTSGVGKLLGAGAQALRASPSVVNALSSAGFRTGAATPTLASKAVDMATRIGAGGLAGGVTAGMVNPNDADTGAMVGAALPPAMKTAGVAGHALASSMSGPAPSAGTLAAAKEAVDSGYVIPPTQVNPSFRNRLLEGLSGKISMAQNASAKNQTVTTAKAVEELGLPAGTQLTPQGLGAIRTAAGQSYETVRNTGTANTGQLYDDALDKIVAPFKNTAKNFPKGKPNPVIDEIEGLRTSAVDASAAVDKIKQLRNQADVEWRRGDKDATRAYKAAANALEDVLDRHLVSIGAPADTLKNFREARKLIAKTHTVEKALNETTGTVNASVLASELHKGKPLSGKLAEAARFAQAFPKAAQTPEKMGSLPQLSPLDWGATAITAGVTGSWLPMAGLAARPLAREAMLSGPVQRGLLGGGQSAVTPELEALLYRSAPLLAGAR